MKSSQAYRFSEAQLIRETLLSRGPEHASTEELIATIIDVNRKGQSARALAAHLLTHAGSANGLASLPIEEFAHRHRLGMTRACRLAAALALGRRSLETPRARGLVFLKPRHVFDYFRPRMAGLKKESFFALHLDTKHRCLREERVSEGTLTASLVHPREVFRTAVSCSAYGLLIVHNHPSGDPSPSDEDREVTSRLVQCGRLLGIPLIDHVIVGQSSYFSLCQEEPGSKSNFNSVRSMPDRTLEF